MLLDIFLAYFSLFQYIVISIKCVVKMFVLENKLES